MTPQRLLLLTRTVPAAQRQTVAQKSRNSMQEAAIALQDKLISGFEENLGGPVDLFNLLPVSRWPSHYADAAVRGGAFAHAPGAEDYNAGFCNVAYLKRVLLLGSYLRQLRRYLRRTRHDVVIGYSADRNVMAGLAAAKKRDSAVHTCLIVPDMPEFNDLGQQSPLMRLYTRWNAAKTRSYLRCIDSFVYLTEQSADYFCPGKPYAVVEGIAEPPAEAAVAADGEKVILYTGTTHAAFGALDLVEAFRQIPGAEYRLVICGCGDSDAAIRASAREDSRIDFRGIVPRAEALRLQQQATVLVNPRKNVGEFTKYSFPSKTMEYLASGVPVVAYRLDGIPAEYENYLTYVPDDSLEALAQTLQQVASLPAQVRGEMGQKAREFVLTQKNPKAQTAKILALF